MASHSGSPPTSPPPPPSNPPSATRSPPQRVHSRNASTSSQSAAQQHLPSVPSALRQAHMPPPSPDDRRGIWRQDAPEFERDGIHPHVHLTPPAESESLETGVRGEIEEPAEAPTVHSRLLDLEHRYHLPHNCGQYKCNHGAFSPRPRYQRGYGSIASNYGGPARESDNRSLNEYGGPTPGGSDDIETRSYRGDFVDGTLGERVTAGLLGKSSKTKTTNWLAKENGVKSTRWMYVIAIPHILSSHPHIFSYIKVY